MVTPHGFEPQLLRSERSVLPLDDGVEKSTYYTTNAIIIANANYRTTNSRIKTYTRAI